MGIKGRCFQTQLLHLWFPSHEVQRQFLSGHLPLCRALAEADNWLLIVGADSRNRTFHFFLGSVVVSGWISSTWMTLSFFLPSAIKICGWYYFCWHCVELIIPCFFQRTEVCLFLHHNWNPFPNSGKICGGETISMSPCLAVSKGWMACQFGLETSLCAWFLVSPWAMYTW